MLRILMSIIVGWTISASAAHALCTFGDKTPPPQITDLMVLPYMSDNSVKVQWTTTTDAISGVSDLDLRFRASTVKITGLTFGSATRVTGTPYPLAGTKQEKVVSGLTANTVYQFAIKVKDDCNNWSLVSNSLALKTLVFGNTTILMSWIPGDNPKPTCYVLQWGPSTGEYSSTLQTCSEQAVVVTEKDRGYFSSVYAYYPDDPTLRSVNSCEVSLANPECTNP